MESDDKAIENKAKEKALGKQSKFCFFSSLSFSRFVFIIEKQSKVREWERRDFVAFIENCQMSKT